MRRTVTWGALALAATLALPADASTGPFTGSVRHGQTKSHSYNNNPNHLACPAVIAFYTVELRYTPTTDVLTLSAGGQTAVGSNGYAAVSFERSYCTSFKISVTGTQVASVADYVVTVTRGSGAIS